jgi:hypothetical protein
VTGVLDAILSLLGLASPSPLTAEDNNFILYPASIPSTVQQGALTHTEGGLVTDNQLPARVSAILGPGATFQGVASGLLPFYATAAKAGGSPAPTRDEIARALVVYNQHYLPTATWSAHQVGLRLLLPVEISSDTGAWTVNADLIRTWTASFDGAWLYRLTTPPSPLEVLDPLDLADQVNAFISSEKDQSALAAELGAGVLRNAFDNLFVVYEGLRQIGDRAFGVVLDLLDGVLAHQLDVLASTSAGNGVLRRFAAILAHPPAGLSASDQSALTRANQLLDGALWKTVGGKRTRVSSAELPETSAQRASRGPIHNTVGASTDPSGGFHRLVLGRDVTVGKLVHQTIQGITYRGPAYFGRVLPVPFFEADQPKVNPVNDPKLAARVRLAAAISGNEGAMDAAVLCDAALASSGFQQWSAHAANELPALLARLKDTAPDDFDLFFAMNGLDVQPLANAPGSFQLVGVDATGIPTPMSYTDLRTFFGGTSSPDGAMVDFGTDWAARLRIVALLSEAYRRCQLLQAAARFDRIAAEVGLIHIGTGNVALTQLVTSEQGAALILDTHINRPAHVRSVLQAVANLPGLPAAEGPRDQTLTSRFHDHRDVNDRAHRNQLIDQLGLHTDHGSFAGW